MNTARFYDMPLDRRVAIENTAKRIYRAFDGNPGKIRGFLSLVYLTYYRAVIVSPELEQCLLILSDLISE